MCPLVGLPLWLPLADGSVSHNQEAGIGEMCVSVSRTFDHMSGSGQLP